MSYIQPAGSGSFAPAPRIQVIMIKKVPGPGWTHTVLPIIAGLLLAQMLATFFVWRSNLNIFSQTQALSAAGWIPLPAGLAAALLKTPGAALGGALFFTLSSAAGLVLAAWSAVHLRRRLFGNSRRASAVLILLWLGLIVAINARGLVWFPTLMVLLPPGVTAGLALRGLRRHDAQSRGSLWLVPTAVLLLLTALWTTRLDQELFTTIRDHILLSNPIGQQVNDYYYAYTLHAAELFKSLEQKTIRTCRLPDDLEPAVAARLKRNLAAGDVLVLPPGHPTDLQVRTEGSGGFTIWAGGKRLALDHEAEAHPLLWLPRLSDQTDRFAPFRRLTFFGLLLGFPILLYLSAYGCLRCFAGIMFDAKAATLIASLLCLIAGILLYLPMLGGRSIEMTAADLNATLTETDWDRRVAGLRHIEKHQLEVTDFPSYRALISSPRMVERYWLARALAVSRSPQSHQDLLAMMEDPHPNVICQAYYALGRRGDRRAIEPLRKSMLRSDHWYAQWYGYHALRELGWRQTL
jgi:hypothetical protein